MALLLLAIDDRPLHLKAATKLLFWRLPAAWRARLGISGDASGQEGLLGPLPPGPLPVPPGALGHRPLAEPKDRVLAGKELAARRKKLSEAEVAARQKALEKLVADLLEASVKVCTPGRAGRL